jgi:hypothetical protein
VNHRPNVHNGFNFNFLSKAKHLWQQLQNSKQSATFRNIFSIYKIFFFAVLNVQPPEMRGYVAYLRIDILRISAILTDTDSITSSFKRIRILCHGYPTDMHYTLLLLLLLLLFYFMRIVYIRCHTGTNSVARYRVIEF